MSTNLKIREVWLLHLAGRSAEALDLYRKMEETSPNSATKRRHRLRGFIYEATGSPEQAIREFQEQISVDGDGSGNLCYLAGALAVAGKKNEALQILNQLHQSKEYVSPTELAGVHARLKNTELTLRLLEQAYADHDPQLQTLNLDPFFTVLRSDPRFKDLLRRVGLPSLPTPN
jgi:tetratricopeptide (TPR) repeat protein